MASYFIISADTDAQTKCMPELGNMTAITVCAGHTDPRGNQRMPGHQTDGMFILVTGLEKEVCVWGGGGM